jgi:hypothetical protein
MERSPEDDQQLRTTAKQWACAIRRCMSEQAATDMMYRLLDQLITRLAETTHNILEEQQADLWEGDE